MQFNKMHQVETSKRPAAARTERISAAGRWFIDFTSTSGFIDWRRRIAAVLGILMNRWEKDEMTVTDRDSSSRQVGVGEVLWEVH